MNTTYKNSDVQFSTFVIADRLYGIEVMSVQEVTMPLPLASVPLAPRFVKGLINLRGQISTAIDMRALFGLTTTESSDKMTVVCRHEDCLISLLIDQIGDVVEANEKDFERAPDTVSSDVKKYIKGVHKMDGHLLTIIDVEKVFSSINQKGDAA